MNRLLECPVCLEEMRPPARIFQCSRGHALCGGCRARPEVRRCPTCRLAFTPHTLTRSILAEHIAEAVWESGASDEAEDTITEQEMLALSTRGPAAQHQGGRCGVFGRAGAWRGLPCYRQLHSLDTEWAVFLYSGHGDGWRVGEVLGGPEFSLWNPSTSSSVPEAGWQYRAGDSSWHLDPDLAVAGLSTPTCSSVTIPPTGAWHHHTDSLGTFTPTGDYSCGRQVFRSAQGSYLLVPPGKNCWGVYQDTTDTAARSLQGGWAAGLCPVQSWVYPGYPSLAICVTHSNMTLV